MFYCWKGIHDLGDCEFHKPYRIVKIPDNFPFKPNLRAYKSIKDLKENDPNWKEFNRQDKKGANKICEPKRIIEFHDYILCPWDKEFNEVSVRLLHHTIKGELLRRSVSGFHFQSNIMGNVEIVEVLEEPDEFGVWVAKIRYHTKKRKVSFSEKKSTMFPSSWNKNQIMFEIYFAWKNKFQCKTFEHVYHSRTLSNVEVKFIISKGECKTVYPIHSRVKNLDSL